MGVINLGKAVLILTVILRSGECFLCSPENNVYYSEHLKRCRRCDKCLVGAGTDVKFQVSMIETFGAVVCRPCRPCAAGTFNARRAFKCKKCRDCADRGRQVKRPCTQRSNAVCGDLLPTENNMTTTVTNQSPPLDKITENPVHRQQAHTKSVSQTYVWLPLVIVSIAVTVCILSVTLLREIILNRKVRDSNHVVRPSKANMARSGFMHVVNMADKAISEENHRRNMCCYYNSNGSMVATPIDSAEEDEANDESSTEIYLLTHVEEDGVDDFQTVDDSMVSTQSNMLTTDSTTIKIVPSTFSRLEPPLTQPPLTDKINGKPNEKYLKQVIQNLSRHIAPGGIFKQLGRELGVSMTDINVIVEDNKGNSTEQAYQTLVKWLHKCKNASVEKLHNALKKINKQHFINKIQQCHQV